MLIYEVTMKSYTSFSNLQNQQIKIKTVLPGLSELLKENIYIVDKFLKQETNLIDKIRILVSIFKHSRLQRKY